DTVVGKEKSVSAKSRLSAPIVSDQRRSRFVNPWNRRMLGRKVVQRCRPHSFAVRFQQRPARAVGLLIKRCYVYEIKSGDFLQFFDQRIGSTVAVTRSGDSVGCAQQRAIALLFHHWVG